MERSRSWKPGSRVRRLRTRPTYTALAMVTLALGVGGMAAIAGIVRPLLVNPLPYPATKGSRCSGRTTRGKAASSVASAAMDTIRRRRRVSP